jgi:hypothetical protein
MTKLASIVESCGKARYDVNKTSPQGITVPLISAIKDTRHTALPAVLELSLKTLMWNVAIKED